MLLAVVRPVGFLLLRYSVLCTVESFSLLYLGLCVLGRWCMDGLGVFMQTKHLLCLGPHLNWG